MGISMTIARPRCINMWREASLRVLVAQSKPATRSRYISAYDSSAAALLRPCDTYPRRRASRLEVSSTSRTCKDIRSGASCSRRPTTRLTPRAVTTGPAAITSTICGSPWPRCYPPRRARQTAPATGVLGNCSRGESRARICSGWMSLTRLAYEFGK